MNRSRVLSPLRFTPSGIYPDTVHLFHAVEMQGPMNLAIGFVHAVDGRRQVVFQTGIGAE